MELTKNIPASFEVTYEMRASAGKRFANLFVDNIIRILLASMLDIIAYFMYYVLEQDGLLLWLAELNPFVDILISLVVVTLYYVIMETKTQRTVGKYITNTMVVMEDGSKPDVGTVFKRTLCRFIPFEQFSFLGDKVRGWHDSISKTYVVDVLEYRRAFELKSSFDEIGKETDYNRY